MVVERKKNETISNALNIWKTIALNEILNYVWLVKKKNFDHLMIIMISDLDKKQTHYCAIYI